MTRIRTRRQSNNVGSYVSRGGNPCALTFWNHNWDRGAERCTDETFVGDGHLFSTSKAEWAGGLIQGTGGNCGSTAIVPRVIDFVPQTFRALQPDVSWHLAIPGRPTNSELGTKLLAETNPSRPVVDLPVLLGELPEFVHLARGYGNGWLKAIARGNLTYQFGIRPLISDLTSLMSFHDEYAKRMRELRSLKQGTLRRKRALFRGRTTSGGSWVVNSGSTNGGTIDTNFSKITEEEVWGFTRWKPSIGFPETDDALRTAAWRAVLGLTVDFSTAWNLMPWSWLVDWCTSAGDYLLANRNIIPCTATGTCVMSRQTTTVIYTHAGGSFPNGMTLSTPVGPWVVKVYSKSRNPVSATLDAHLPILSYRQLSILGSIGISKYRF